MEPMRYSTRTILMNPKASSIVCRRQSRPSCSAAEELTAAPLSRAGFSPGSPGFALKHLTLNGLGV